MDSPYTHPTLASDRMGEYFESRASNLSKREYFAGLALQGLLAGPGEVMECAEWDACAKYCVDAADALIAALGDNGKAG